MNCLACKSSNVDEKGNVAKCADCGYRWKISQYAKRAEINHPLEDGSTVHLAGRDRTIVDPEVRAEVPEKIESTELPENQSEEKETRTEEVEISTRTGKPKRKYTRRKKKD